MSSSTSSRTDLSFSTASQPQSAADEGLSQPQSAADEGSSEPQSAADEGSSQHLSSWSSLLHRFLQRNLLSLSIGSVGGGRGVL
jgi:hypothetical protein